MENLQKLRKILIIRKNDNQNKLKTVSENNKYEIFLLVGKNSELDYMIKLVDQLLISKLVNKQFRN